MTKIEQSIRHSRRLHFLYGTAIAILTMLLFKQMAANTSNEDTNPTLDKETAELYNKRLTSLDAGNQSTLSFLLDSITRLGSCANSRKLTLDQFLDKMLKRETVYEFLDKATLKPDTEGYGSVNSMFEFYLSQYLRSAQTQTILIVEVGTYKGSSAIAFAQICKRLAINRKCIVIAVDTFLGSSTHMEWALDRPELRDRSGSFGLYKTFAMNIKFHNLSDIVFPLRLPSLSAAKTLRCFGIMTDFVYIDAEHEYISALQDISLFYITLKRNGYMMGHDYAPNVFPTVVDAVNDFVYMKHERLLNTTPAMFTFRKSH